MVAAISARALTDEWNPLSEQQLQFSPHSAKAGRTSRGTTNFAESGPGLQKMVGDAAAYNLIDPSFGFVGDPNHNRVSNRYLRVSGSGCGVLGGVWTIWVSGVIARSSSTLVGKLVLSQPGSLGVARLPGLISGLKNLGLAKTDKHHVSGDPALATSSKTRSWSSG